jgi:hypothetical protein
MVKKESKELDGWSNSIRAAQVEGQGELELDLQELRMDSMVWIWSSDLRQLAPLAVPQLHPFRLMGAVSSISPPA